MAAQTQVKIPNYNEVKVELIDISRPKDNQGGKGQTSYLRSKQFVDFNDTIYFTLNDQTVAYSLDQYTDPKTGIRDGKYTLNIRLDEDENGEYVNKDVVDFVQRLENQVKTIVANRAREWRLPNDFANKMTSLVKSHYNKKSGQKYPDTLSVRVNYDPEKRQFRSKFYNTYEGKQTLLELTESTAPNEIMYGTKCNLILKVRKLWISGNGWGITFELESGSFSKSIRKFELPLPSAVEVNTIDDDIETTVVSAPVQVAQVDTSIEDDIEQPDELEMSEQVTPVATPIPKKKTTATKKTK